MPREARSFEGDVAAAVEGWLHTYMPAVAERLGPLPDSVIPTKNELLERWDLRTDKVPPESVPQLAAEALKMIVEEHAAAGKEPPSTDTLTKLVAAKTNAVLYPYREKVYGTGTPRPEDRVKAARQYAREAAKRVEQAVPMVESLAQGETRPGAVMSTFAPMPTVEPTAVPVAPEIPPAVQALAGGAGY